MNRGLLHGAGAKEPVGPRFLPNENMTTAEKLSEYVLPTYGRFPIEPSHGKGTELWDVDGKRYLDFCTGIAVCALGHSHPRMLSALQEQASKLMHCSNLYHIPGQADLAELIVERCIDLPGKMFFSNSGAEANDGMIKLARRYGHQRPNTLGENRFEIITFNQSFHGRTIGAMSATGQAKIQDRFQPLLPGFRHTPYNDIKALEQIIGDRTVAIMLEPIQGEGGIHPASAEFLAAIERLCQKHDLLLLLDEVQCGFGRMGPMMGWRAFSETLQPDVISWAKGMGGGFPIGGFWISDRMIQGDEVTLSSLLGPGSHGSTYGGNPLACAVSHAVISEILEQDLGQNAQTRAAQIREEIASWEHELVVEVRGEGLLLGIALDSRKVPLREGEMASIKACNTLASLGLLVPPAGGETIRLLPPLNVTAQEVSEALALLKQGLDHLLND